MLLICAGDVGGNNVAINYPDRKVGAKVVRSEQPIVQLSFDGQRVRKADSYSVMLLNDHRH